MLLVYAHHPLEPGRQHALGPYRAVVVVLPYLRHNLPRALIAELFGCSQPTVSRLLRSTVRVDGFLALGPCRSFTSA